MPKGRFFIIYLLPLFLALFLRAPFVSTGLPFFYNEDEGHHFNRVVNMVKSGSYDPEYFLKPSLHFYLRMPVVAASFLWNVRKGNIRTVDEIKTKNDYGLGGYNYTVSHPGIVKWNRAFSLLLNLSTIVIAIFISSQILPASTYLAPLTTGIVLACIPPHVTESSIIGVDVVVAFFTLLTTLLILRLPHDKLWIAGLTAGLSVSSKYNAAPVLLIPFIALLLSGHRSIKSALFISISAILGFLIGTPYSLLRLPLFLNHLAYETWHYGVSGHEGHMAQPGIEQALFYGDFLLNHAFFILGSIFLLLGIASVIKKRNGVLLFSFPLLFLLFMISQKTNFTRNLLPLYPYGAIFIGIGMSIFADCIPTKKKFFCSAILILTLLPLFRSSLLERDLAATSKDARILTQNYLQENIVSQNKEIALFAELQPQRDLIKLPMTSLVSQKTETLESLAQKGFSFAIFPGETSQGTTIKQFGKSSLTRVLKDPLMSVIDLTSIPLTPHEVTCTKSLTNSYSCPTSSPTEPYSWLTTKRTKLLGIPLTGRKSFSVKMSSPWENQAMTLMGAQFTLTKEAKMYTVQISDAHPDLEITLSKVLSPSLQAGSQDTRRLGAAVYEIMVQ